MRMFHPDLPHTEKDGIATTDAAFELAWAPKGWLAWPPVATKKTTPKSKED